MDNYRKILFSDAMVRDCLPKYIAERQKMIYENIVSQKTAEDLAFVKGQLKELGMMAAYLQGEANGNK